MSSSARGVQKVHPLQWKHHRYTPAIYVLVLMCLAVEML